MVVLVVVVVVLLVVLVVLGVVLLVAGGWVASYSMLAFNDKFDNSILVINRALSFMAAIWSIKSIRETMPKTFKD